LSSDELQYIADFFGACILEAMGSCGQPARTEDEVALFERFRHPRPEHNDALEDHQHKMILLVEYLSRSGLGQPVAALRATGRAS
jgi:hypothetical protein